MSRNLQRMKRRTVTLLPEVDRRLTQYAKLRQQTPEQCAGAAIEQMLREHADLQLRLADARRIADQYRV